MTHTQASSAVPRARGAHDPPGVPHGLFPDLSEQVLAALDVSFTIADPRQPDCPLVWANAAFSRTTGYAHDEVIGRNCRFLQGDGTDPVVVARLRDGIAAGRPVHAVLLNYRKDGSRFWNELNLSPIRDADGVLTHYVGVQADVTAAVTAAYADERARRRLEVLGRATGELGAALDGEQSLGDFARAVVPELADICVVNLVASGEGSARRPARQAAVAAVDPAAAELLDRIARESSARDNPRALLGRALLHREPQLVAEVTEEAIQDGTAGTGTTDLYRQLNLRSVIIAPMVARGRLLGAISLLTTSASGRTYAAADLALAEDLARRAALAVDNAWLYAREHTVAETLQRSLLPELPEVPGLQLAARYRPAHASAQVGGDWYDVLPLPDGTVGFAIGDVMGHDLAATAGMGQMRSVLRSYAYEGAAPVDVLKRLDRLVIGLDPDRLATVVYGVLLRADAACPALPGTAGLLRYANAGHLPPLLKLPDGEVRRLEGGQGVLIGGTLPDMTPPPWQEARELVPAGSLLVLYTDGLVEHRGGDLGDGLTALQDALTELDTGPADGPVCASVIADALLDRVLDADAQEDDAALLVARIG